MDWKIVGCGGDKMENEILQPGKKFCKHCGQQIDKDCIVCPICGKQVEDLKANQQPVIIQTPIQIPLMSKWRTEGKKKTNG